MTVASEVVAPLLTTTGGGVAAGRAGFAISVVGVGEGEGDDSGTEPCKDVLLAAEGEFVETVLDCCAEASGEDDCVMENWPCPWELKVELLSAPPRSATLSTTLAIPAAISEIMLGSLSAGYLFAKDGKYGAGVATGNKRAPFEKGV